MQLPDPVELGDLLEPFSRRGIDLGLDRLHQALAAGGHPEQRFPAVQVAGTNGKGSICTALGAILQAAGLKAGLYRSPHLISWCERIAIGDQWIAAEQLQQGLQQRVEQWPQLLAGERGWGLIRGLLLRDDSISAIDLVKAAMAEGLLLVPAGSQVVRFVPPLVINRRQINQALQRLDQALSKLAA